MSFGEESRSVGPSVGEKRESLLGDNRLRWRIDPNLLLGEWAYRNTFYPEL